METKNAAQNYNCVSKVVFKPFSFRWRIEQFPIRLLKVGDQLFSSEFDVGIDNVSLFVGVKRCRVENGDEKLGVYLGNASRENSVKVDFSITLVNSHQPEKSIKKKAPNVQIFEFGVGSGLSISHFSRFIDKERGFVATDNSLTVLVEGVDFDEKQGEFDLVLREDVGEDFGKLFDEGAHSDFVVKAKDAEGKEKEFKVHRNILAARSQYFAAMLSNPDVKECREGQMMVKDIDSGAMEALLRFLYTGKYSPSEPSKEVKENNKELELLIAADKYGILKLKNHLERVLAAKLSIEIVCECFVIAKRHSAPFLVARCKEFVRGRVGEVSKTDGWHRLCTPENAELVADLFTP